jgi:hypothetical protein
VELRAKRPFKDGDPQASWEQPTFRLLKILYNQEDFKQQKSLLREFYEDTGHLCLYYPKFHCELNFTEQYWGNAKF